MAQEQKNFGDQIKDAIDNAINSNDFSALKETVGQTLNRAAYEVSKGLAKAQEEARRNQEQAEADRQRRQQEQAAKRQEYAMRQQERAQLQQRQMERRKQELQRRQEMAAVQYRFKKIGGMKAAGFGMTAGGIVLALGFSGGVISSLIGTALVGSVGFGATAGVMGVLLAASIGLIIAGIHKVRFADLFRKYQDIIGTRMFCNVDELAGRTGKDIPFTVSSLKKMLKRGMFTEGVLAPDDKILMVAKESYQQYQNAIEAQKERERKQKLIASVSTNDGAQAPLSPEQRSLLEMGKAYVAKIRASNEAIPDAIVSKKIDQIELVVNKIFEYAREHPEVIPELERLMDYYLPTTVKLLDAYAALDAQPIQGENITASKKEIEETLDTLAVAFEKLLDSIFRDMTWDVSTDISVLHTVLAQEGLVEGAFEHKSEDGSH